MWYEFEKMASAIYFTKVGDALLFASENGTRIIREHLTDPDNTKQHR